MRYNATRLADLYNSYIETELYDLRKQLKENAFLVYSYDEVEKIGYKNINEKFDNVFTSAEKKMENYNRALDNKIITMDEFMENMHNLYDLTKKKALDVFDRLDEEIGR